jgi:hypothetical protein
MSRLRGIPAFVLAVAAIGLLCAVVLPWLARSGYAGAVLQRNYDQQVDATPLFYTDSERTMEVLRERAARPQ